MSDVPDLGLDLENLFQPAWTKGKGETNRFDKFTGLEGVRPERRGRREGFGGDRRGPRREGGFGGGERRGGPPRGGSKFGGGRKPFGRGDDRGERRERPEPPAP